MRTWEIEFLPRAEKALRALFLYITSDDENAALAMVARIEESVMRLSKSPFIGMELSPDEYPAIEIGLRRLVVRPYIVFYRVLDERIVITHIIHSRRNLGRVLFEDDEAE